MFTFKIFDEFVNGESKELLSHHYYSVFMEDEKIVLGLIKESCPDRLYRYFKKDYIVLGELNLNEMEDYHYKCFSQTITLNFETGSILETLKSLKPFFPLYLHSKFVDINNETFFCFNMKNGITSFLEESLHSKYEIDFSVFELKGLEDYEITNIFTYSSESCAGISEYVKYNFYRFNEEHVNEEVAARILSNIVNNESIEDSEESDNLLLTKVTGFNSLYDVFNECYTNYLKKKDLIDVFKVMTDTDKHKNFILDLEKVLSEINTFENVNTNNELLVFNCKEQFEGCGEDYKNTYICFYKGFVILFAEIFSC